MHITLVAGARPNFIKLAPIIWATERAKDKGSDINYTLVYTGREDDPTLDADLYEQLEIPRPDIFLGVDCESINELTGKVMAAFDSYLERFSKDDASSHTVIVCDDLASTMAVAIVTKKRGLRLAHLVAGTRSFDINMPKEINRLVIDGLSDLMFTAGVNANSIATREGAELNKIYMVGNLLIDTLRHNHTRFSRPSCIDGIDKYLVLTINRKALISDSAFLENMVAAIEKEAGNIPVIAPLHSLAAKAISPLLSPVSPIRLVDSLSYLEFGYLTSHALGIITDSGNVAEEATFNSVPCITLNDYTEHIETVTIGSNTLVGSDTCLLSSTLADIIAGKYKRSAIPDRWDGRTAERILQSLC
ncbi:MAG: UDP-N-acetyl glucosamine 2-epimerase [Prevotella sp.]